MPISNLLVLNLPNVSFGKKRNMFSSSLFYFDMQPEAFILGLTITKWFNVTYRKDTSITFQSLNLV